MSTGSIPETETEAVQVESRKEPVFFPAGDETLFGVSIIPAGASHRRAVTLFPGAGQVTSTHRNAMFVRLARALAELGWPSLRVDYRGCGESSGSVAVFSLDALHTGAVDGAMRWQRQRGTEEHVLIGTCFGARTLLGALPDVESLLGVALVSPPVQDFPMGDGKQGGERRPPSLRRMIARGCDLLWEARRREQRRLYWHFIAHALNVRMSALASAVRTRSRPQVDIVSRSMLYGLQSLARRNVPVLLMYGEPDKEYHDFQRALSGRLGRLLNSAPSIEVRVFDGPVHGFEQLRSQEAVIDTVATWVSHLALPGESEAKPATTIVATANAGSGDA
jgi:pimeloyl-ACP methyl ester carboxylesterase